LLQLVLVLAPHPQNAPGAPQTVTKDVAKRPPSQNQVHPAQHNTVKNGPIYFEPIFYFII